MRGVLYINIDNIFIVTHRRMAEELQFELGEFVEHRFLGNTFHIPRPKQIDKQTVFPFIVRLKRIFLEVLQDDFYHWEA